VLRFGLIGGTNTVVSSAAFYSLAAVLPARVAFTLVYVAGLALVSVITPRYVFGTRPPRHRRLLLVLWYLATYFVGIAMITLLRSEVSTERVVVVLGTVMVTAPLGFIGGRLLVGGRGYVSGSGSSAAGSGSTPSG
jgi:putative flippase GtrA